MTVELTIIGLGQIGASFGLALSGEDLHVNRSGYDRIPEVATKAQKLGAVDKVFRNLHSAVEKADLVILAIPPDEIRSTLEEIANDLQPGTVVIDTYPLKTAVAGLADKLLPKDRNFVSLTPMINAAYLEEMKYGVESARPDLFKNAIALITAPSSTDPDALRVAGDLANILGSKPLFADPFEADGLLASSHFLPLLVSSAVVAATTGQPGWHEARKLAGPAYAQVTEPLMNVENTSSLGHSAIQNQENILRVLDNVTTEIQKIRKLVSEADEAGLDDLLLHTRNSRIAWWGQRLSNDWEGRPIVTEIPTVGETMTRFFGFRRKKPGQK